MKLQTILLTIPLTFTTFIGCGDDNDSVDPGDSSASGSASYVDAETDDQGEEQEAAKPDAQQFAVSVEVNGTGDLQGLEGECEVSGAAGAFAGQLGGVATLDDEGVYVSALAEIDGSFLIPETDCEVPTVSAAVYTDISVVARLAVNEANCSGYCAAKGREYGEFVCNGDEDVVTCRAEAEADYSVSCTAACDIDDDTLGIVASVSLSAEQLAEVNAQELSGKALGEVALDFQFERIENGDGEPVDEEPSEL